VWCAVTTSDQSAIFMLKDFMRKEKFHFKYEKSNGL